MNTTKRLISTGLAALVLATVPGVAYAQEAPPDTAPVERPTAAEGARAEAEARWFETLQARALEAIEKRLATLDDLEAAIARSESVTADHAAALLAEVRASHAGLAGLAGEIRAATDLETLRVLVPKIFEDYRVYAVTVPKVHLVVAADGAGAIAARLDEATEAIGSMLDRLAEAGFDVADGEALLAEMERLVESGATSAAAVPPMVLGLTPADYPGSSEVLRSAHGTLQSAGTDLRSAGDTAREIGAFIRALFDNDAD
ncbi:MAG: hypothetical protein HKN74_13995 [Acidimicrobiia bacterium]|nr:hypothetical protein [Acidimicrobiia bacterium]